MNTHAADSRGVGLNDLPMELRERICSNLPSRDLKRLRLASKHYASPACRYLRIIIYLFDETESCREALEIARHADLSRVVTTVAVDVSQIKAHDDFYHWVDDPKAHAPFRARELKLNKTPEDLQKWYKIHQELARYQNDSSSATVLLDTLTKLLSTCPILKEMMIITSAYGAGSPKLAFSYHKNYVKFSSFLKLYSSKPAGSPRSRS